MLFLAKIIGVFCTVAVPAGVCGTQALLTKKTQLNQKKEIEAELKHTQDSLNTAHNNYREQITRINNEKNALATTKSTLTYVPVDVKTKITELQNKKTEYESRYTQLQQEITQAITKHNQSLQDKTTEIEDLWKAEKTRVEAIQKDLDDKISKATSANTTLRDQIDTLKTEIDKTINDAFYTP